MKDRVLLLCERVSFGRARLAVLVEDHPVFIIDKLPCQMAKVLYLAAPVVPHCRLGFEFAAFLTSPSEELAFSKQPVTKGLFMNFLQVCFRQLVCVIRSVIAVLLAQKTLKTCLEGSRRLRLSSWVTFGHFSGENSLSVKLRGVF